MKKLSHIPVCVAPKRSETVIKAMRAQVLAWYDDQGRTMPWRIRPEDRANGVVADPYAVWLFEIMSQQTTIAHAEPYWQKFLEQFPTVTDLADADRDRVLAMWAGLGYYARARNLHKCAVIVRDECRSIFPDNEAGLLKLPGIGPYTAATIAAICYEEATNIVDGNVERLMSRIFRVQALLPKAKPEIRSCAATLVRSGRCGDYGQALIDLGAVICTPRKPKCEICPWLSHCAAFAHGDMGDYPKKTPKKKQPIRYGTVFVLRCGDDILLERRDDKGLLGGMMGFIGSDWNDAPVNDVSLAPQARNWQRLETEIRHIFTHFDLRLRVYAAQTDHKDLVRPYDALWAPLDKITDYALPSLYKKVLKAALDNNFD
ncbi:MAG: A/G-specific adenine glycosylase [Litorimonas sp.]